MPDAISAGAASFPFQYGGFVNKVNSHVYCTFDYKIIYVKLIL